MKDKPRALPDEVSKSAEEGRTSGQIVEHSVEQFDGIKSITSMAYRSKKGGKRMKFGTPSDYGNKCSP
jgi:hypothetical protein